MKRFCRLAGLPAAATAVALAAMAVAQPPEGGPPGRGPGGPPHDPLRAALDADGDRELGPEEIKNAPAALATLDRDGDGRISREECRPPRPPRRGPPDEGFEGRGSLRDGERPPQGKFREGRPPREGRRPPGEGGRPEGGPPRGPSPERFVGRALEFDGDGDGKLDRDELEQFAEEMRQRIRGGGRGPGGPGGPGGAENGPPEDDERPPRFEE